jgi:hypothetical protein
MVPERFRSAGGLAGRKGPAFGSGRPRVNLKEK